MIEIGLTPNRNDAMGHWGVARDLRAGLLHGTVDGVGPMEVNDLRLPAMGQLDDALARGGSISWTLTPRTIVRTTWPWSWNM